jgi:O-antigen/teichoic acid export membrane protein
MHSRHVTVLDQIASSASNFLLVAIVANVSPAEQFGQFSLGYVLLVFFLGLQRSLIGEVLLVRFAAKGADLGGFRAATGLATLLGVVALAVLAVGAFFARESSPEIWLVLAVTMPVLLLQDALRYVLICRKLSGYAFVLDAVWAVLSTAAMLLLALARADGTWVVGAWAAGALVSAVLGIAITKAYPRPLRGIAWFLANRDLSVRFSAEFASLNASTALVWFALAGPLGAVGIAALRGASLLFSPLNTAFNSVRIAMIPELVRSRNTPRYRRGLMGTGAVLLGLGVVWAAVVLLLPDSLGRIALGDTWDSAKDLRLPNAVQALAMVGYTTLLAYYRSSSLHVHSSWMRGILAGMTLAVPFFAALAFGVQGGAWGFAAAVAVALVGGLSITAAARRRGRERGLEPGGEPA